MEYFIPFLAVVGAAVIGGLALQFVGNMLVRLMERFE